MLTVMSVRSRLFLVLALLATGAAGCDNSVDQSVPDPLATPDGWALVWSDEFDGAEVDESKWTITSGDGCPELCGFGNNELQVYTRTNHTVADGLLTITARQEADGGYTSTKMDSRNKGDWTYGRFEIRAKLPETQGLWPAIWMLFTDDTYGGWAASGEIDIMEYTGDRPDEVFGTIHYGGPAPRNEYTPRVREPLKLFSGSYADDFYVFTVEWDPAVPDNPDTAEVDEFVPTTIRWYVNNVLYQTKTEADWFSTGAPAGNTAAPFDHDFFLLLNVAVGGNLPGPPDETTVFPQTMQVDYVRVYQRTP